MKTKKIVYEVTVISTLILAVMICSALADPLFTFNVSVNAQRLHNDVSDVRVACYVSRPNGVIGSTSRAVQIDQASHSAVADNLVLTINQADMYALYNGRAEEVTAWRCSLEAQCRNERGYKSLGASRDQDECFMRAEGAEATEVARGDIQ